MEKNLSSRYNALLKSPTFDFFRKVRVGIVNLSLSMSRIVVLLGQGLLWVFWFAPLSWSSLQSNLLIPPCLQCSGGDGAGEEGGGGGRCGGRVPYGFAEDCRMGRG